MEDLILVALRVVFAILWGLLDGLSYWPFDFGFEKASAKCPLWLLLCIYFGLGCAIGGLSLLVFPYTWLQEPTLRIVNLVVSPIAGGSIGYLSARHFYRNVEGVYPKEHFWSGFWFALGVSAIRFTYCAR